MNKIMHICLSLTYVLFFILFNFFILLETLHQSTYTMFTLSRYILCPFSSIIPIIRNLTTFHISSIILCMYLLWSLYSIHACFYHLVVRNMIYSLNSIQVKRSYFNTCSQATPQKNCKSSMFSII